MRDFELTDQGEIFLTGCLKRISPKGNRRSQNGQGWESERSGKGEQIRR